MKTREAIILAGGFGTRLQSVVSDVPKPMAPVCDRPFLEYQLDYLINQGIERVVLSLGYLPETIITHFGNQYKTLQLLYAVEDHPLGTGGAIAWAAEKIEGDYFWVFNGDSLFEVDLPEMEKACNSTSAGFALALRKVQDVSRYGSVETDSNGMITLFKEKSTTPAPGYINGGVYLIRKADLIDNVPGQRFSIEKSLFMPAERPVLMYGYPSDSYFIDIGIPEDYKKAQHDFINRK